MGKASSAKKVARAARAGGKTSKRERPKLAFPLAVFVILVVGVLLVVFARSAKIDSASADTAPSATKKDHWHAAYGLYVCDKYLPPLPESATDALGIHSHGDGVMHVHPFTSAASGNNATLKVFFDSTNVKLTDDGWIMPDGTEYKNGMDCNGKPGKMAIYRWSTTDPTQPVEVFDQGGYNNIKYRQDRDAYAIAIVPEGTDAPPKPDTIANLDKLTDVPGQGAAAGGAGATSGAPGGATPGGATTGGATPGAATPGAATPPVTDTPVSSTPASSTPASSTP